MLLLYTMISRIRVYEQLAISEHFTTLTLNVMLLYKEHCSTQIKILLLLSQ